MISRTSRKAISLPSSSIAATSAAALVISGISVVSLTRLLAQPRPRVHLEQGPATHRVPLRHERDRLPDHVEIAPALGEAALATVRRAAAVPVHQIHRLAGAVGGVGGGQPATGSLLEGGGLAGRDGVPHLGDRRAAVGATGIENRVRPPHRVLDLWIVAEPSRPAAC